MVGVVSEAMTTLSNTEVGPISSADRRAKYLSSTTQMLVRCSVVSWHDGRLDHMRALAEHAHWQVVHCRDAREALRAAFKNTLSLAVIDMPAVDSESYQSYRGLAERIIEVGKVIGASDMLMVLCTSTQSVQEEIWARQLGAWTYLPFAGTDVPFAGSLPSEESATAYNAAMVRGSMIKGGMPMADGSPPNGDERTAGQSGADRKTDGRVKESRMTTPMKVGEAGEVGIGPTGIGMDGKPPDVPTGSDGPTAADSKTGPLLPLSGPFDHEGLLMVFREARLALANMTASQTKIGTRMGTNIGWDLKLTDDTSKGRSTSSQTCQENGLQKKNDQPR